MIDYLQYHEKKRSFYDRLLVYKEYIFISNARMSLSILKYSTYVFLNVCSYNCEDPNCYADLSRLRGLKYVTWENKDKLVQQDEVRVPNRVDISCFNSLSITTSVMKRSAT